MWTSDIAPHFSLGTRLSVLRFTPRPLYALRSAFNPGYYMARSGCCGEEKNTCSETLEELIEIRGNSQPLLWMLRAKFEEVHLFRGCCGWLLWTHSAVQNVASFLAGGELGEAGGRAYWVWWSGEGWVLVSYFSVTRSAAYSEVERRH